LYLLAVSSWSPNPRIPMLIDYRNHSSMTRKIPKNRKPSRRERIALEKNA